jgi:ribulose-5-phosphate 4-epimerase/fuculose-1-phosphate aldolase
MDPSHPVKIDFEGNVLKGRFRPSVKASFHAERYKLRPDINMIVQASTSSQQAWTTKALRYSLYTSKPPC